MTDLPRFVLERSFDAPPELVWRTWTDPKLFARWYGPGAETIITSFEARSGGGWRLEMRMGQKVGYQRADFTEFEPPSRLVWLQSVLDAAGNVASDPNMPDWPRRLLTEITFAENAAGGTDLKLVWTPHECSEAEVAFFAQAIGWLGKGWGAGMDAIDTILAELQAG